MSSRDRDAGRKFESGSSKRKRAIKKKQVEENLRGSLYKYIKTDDQETSLNPDPAENIPSTSSWVPPLPPLSLSKNSEGDVEVTTSLPLRSPGPPSTLSSQDHESEPESMLTSMTAEIENLNPQNDPGLWPITITNVDRTEIVLKGPIRAKVDLFPINDNGRRFSEYHYNKSSLLTAREIAEENDINRQFKEVRRRRKKRHFDYEGEDEALELNAEEMFKINYFYVIVDTVRASCRPRFEALKQHESIFGFMYNVKRLKEISDSELLKQCSDLQISMTVGESCDIDGHELYEELNMFIRVYEGKDDIISVLKYIIENKLTEVYPTIEIVLRIIATTPVTVASAERSFSRLKITKTYLRNSMTQDRLSALAILSIENDVAHSLDYCELIKDFSLKKSRKHQF
ncbi:hypothetical protein ACJJTC_008332 [Scirpophaga incertulas]